jgi:hypothetical protein
MTQQRVPSLELPRRSPMLDCWILSSSLCSSRGTKRCSSRECQCQALDRFALATRCWFATFSPPPQKLLLGALCRSSDAVVLLHNTERRNTRKFTSRWKKVRDEDQHHTPAPSLRLRRSDAACQCSSIYNWHSTVTGNRILYRTYCIYSVR